MIFLELEQFQVQAPGDLNVLQGSAKVHHPGLRAYPTPRTARVSRFSTSPRSPTRSTTTTRKARSRFEDPSPWTRGWAAPRSRTSSSRCWQRVLLALRRALPGRRDPGREVQPAVSLPEARQGQRPGLPGESLRSCRWDGAVTHRNAVGRAPSPDCGLGAGLNYSPRVALVWTSVGTKGDIVGWDKKTAMRFLGRECERAPHPCSHRCEYMGYI